MKWCDLVPDEFGQIVKAIYENGLTFEGQFDRENNPVNGIIKNEKSEIIYEGNLDYDISFYFRQYDEMIRKGQFKPFKSKIN